MNRFRLWRTVLQTALDSSSGQRL